MRFEAQFHEWMQTAGVSQWTRRNGVRGQYAGFGSRPEEVEEAIKFDLARMRTLDIFLPRPWNHVTVTLTENAMRIPMIARSHSDMMARSVPR